MSKMYMLCLRMVFLLVKRDKTKASDDSISLNTHKPENYENLSHYFTSENKQNSTNTLRSFVFLCCGITLNLCYTLF